jgi:hypothetical protein
MKIYVTKLSINNFEKLNVPPLVSLPSSVHISFMFFFYEKKLFNVSLSLIAFIVVN